LILARVVGTIVATKKDDKLVGATLQLVQPVNAYDVSRAEGTPMIAVDAVGAGRGELVVVVTGSSARQSARTSGQPVDYAIVGIIDTVESNGEVTYRSSGE
jgi:ethanolamine utilization protein EutN